MANFQLTVVILQQQLTRPWTLSDKRPARLNEAPIAIEAVEWIDIEAKDLTSGRPKVTGGTHRANVVLLGRFEQ